MNVYRGNRAVRLHSSTQDTCLAWVNLWHPQYAFLCISILLKTDIGQAPLAEKRTLLILGSLRRDSGLVFLNRQLAWIG
jgi:hypothetical protein